MHGGQPPPNLVRRVQRRLRYEVFHRRVVRSNRRFDQRFGTDTATTYQLSSVDADDHLLVDAVDYEAMHAGTLLRILDGLDLDVDSFNFVDLGSGKGKTLLVAATLPFDKVTGVELSNELHQVALSNLDRLGQTGAMKCRSAESLNLDAGRYRETHDDVIVFMMNPFGAAVMSDVVAGLDAHLEGGERRGVVIYVNPLQRAVVETSTSLETVFRSRRLDVDATPSANISPVQLDRAWGSRFDTWSLSRERVDRGSFRAGRR